MIRWCDLGAESQNPSARCDPVLNERQINLLLRFRGDGTGQGITWEPRDEG